MVKLKAVHENCSGCGTCRLACAIENFREVNPFRALLRIQGRFPDPGDYRIHLCDQCGECADNCPEDAIYFDDSVFTVDRDACTGCGICIEVCPYGVMFEQPQSDTPLKCNLCGECALTCPRGAILLVDDQKSEVT
ncbi:MAG: 4Fe-4S binding protein [Desulfobacterales bacterium]